MQTDRAVFDVAMDHQPRDGQRGGWGGRHSPPKPRGFPVPVPPEAAADPGSPAESASLLTQLTF